MPIPDDVQLKQGSTLIANDLQGTTETGIRMSEHGQMKFGIQVEDKNVKNELLKT